MVRHVARTLFIVCLFVTLLAASTQAQQAWLISAGQGWGPLYLGMSEDAVVSVLGQPRNPRGTPTAELDYWEYGDFNLTFWRSSDNPAPTLSGIDITSPRSATREGVRVGSSLSAVLRAYGDSIDTLSKSTSESCLNIGLLGSRRFVGHVQTPPDYGNVFWWLIYQDRGIGFQIVPRGSLLLVGQIKIQAPDPANCGVSF